MADNETEKLQVKHQESEGSPTLSDSSQLLGLAVDQKAGQTLNSSLSMIFNRLHVRHVGKLSDNWRDLFTGTPSKVLVQSVQLLSMAQNLQDVATIIRSAARQIVKADGATFVLREGDQCFYLDEDALSPLWKGMKFPMSACISGWVMMNRTQVSIKDIYQDSRIPQDAYRPTFVKSLAMTPIRPGDPIGAIGTYWASEYQPSLEQLEWLQALADATSAAMQSLTTLKELEQRACSLEKTNQQMNRITWVVSHDLKEPLRNMSVHLDLLEQEVQDKLSATSKVTIQKMKSFMSQTRRLVTDMLEIAKVQNQPLKNVEVDLNIILRDVLSILNNEIVEKKAQISFDALPTVVTDPGMISRVFQNIISNAIKFQKKGSDPVITISSEPANDLPGRPWRISITDNGIGIDQEHFERVFQFFSRIHSRLDYQGSGVGLALCKQIIEDLGGQIGVNSETDKGSCFFFTVPRVAI